METISTASTKLVVGGSKRLEINKQLKENINQVNIFQEKNNYTSAFYRSFGTGGGGQKPPP
jgi:hypothetical protein